MLAMRASIQLGSVIIAMTTLRAVTEGSRNKPIDGIPLKSDLVNRFKGNKEHHLEFKPLMEDNKTSSASNPSSRSFSLDKDNETYNGGRKDAWYSTGASSFGEGRRTLFGVNSIGNNDRVEELGMEQIRKGTKGEGEWQEKDCLDVNTGEQSPTVTELGIRSAELLGKLEILTFALIIQCNLGPLYPDVIAPIGSAGISMCQFSSMASLVNSVMINPEQSLCFLSRRWTVVLLGSPRWANSLITGAKKEGLYDSRVHWIVLVTGKTPVLTTLASYEITHRVTWLRWSDHLKDWVVLASKVSRSGGITAKEAGRWRFTSSGSGTVDRSSGADYRSSVADHRSSVADHRSSVADHRSSGAEDRIEDRTLVASSPLRPTQVENFNRKIVRVISRRKTDEKMVFNPVGRCYFKEDGSTYCTGYVGEMLMIITESLNLSVSNSMVRSCGVADSNGTRVSVIANDGADVSLGTCTITTDRIQVVDFTEFFIVSRSTIVSAEPAVLLSPFLIFSVFSWDTWLAILCYIAIVTVALWITSKIVSLVNADYNKSFPASFAVIIKALLYQGHRSQPLSITGRAVAAVSWVIIITLVGIYSGNLTAWLSLRRYDRPINTLADLVERPHITPYVLAHDPNHLMFKNQTEGLLGAVAKRLLIWDKTNENDFARDIIRGKVAYFNSDRSHIKRATSLNKHEGIEGFAPCRMHLASEDIRQDYLALIISKNSWLSDQVNRQIQWLRSCGVISYLYKKFNPPGCRITTNKDRRRASKTQSLGVLELQGVYWVWVVGMSIATVVLLMEISIHKACLEPYIPSFNVA